MYLIKNIIPYTVKFNAKCNIYVRLVRSSKGSVKLGKELFELTINLHKFHKDEISVKAHPEYVIIEGKQDMQTIDGFVTKQFIKKYKLPERCAIQKMEAKLSPKGILTISAPRECSLPDAADTILIPITMDSRKPDTKLEVQAEDIEDPCASYPKVKPKK